jgi:hypothetical protein
MKEQNPVACCTPCKTCPWLMDNFGKPNPPKVSELRSAGRNDVLDWFSASNAKRLWKEIRRGGQMICHASDPQAENYGGTSAAPGCERACVGMLIVVARHLNSIGQKASLKEYLRENSKYGLSRSGVITWAERIFFNPDMPKEFIIKAPVGVQWPDPIADNNDSIKT